MLSEKKIRLMARLSIYEEKTGKEDLKLNEYYKVDYVRLKVILSIVSVTTGLLILFFMGCFYNTEYLIAEAVGMDYKAIGTRILGIYLIIVTVYIFVSIIGYALSYSNSRKRLRQYLRDLKLLRHIYEKES